MRPLLLTQWWARIENIVHKHCFLSFSIELNGGARFESGCRRKNRSSTHSISYNNGVLFCGFVDALSSCHSNVQPLLYSRTFLLPGINFVKYDILNHKRTVWVGSKTMRRCSAYKHLVSLKVVLYYRVSKCIHINIPSILVSFVSIFFFTLSNRHTRWTGLALQKVTSRCDQFIRFVRSSVICLTKSSIRN